MIKTTTVMALSLVLGGAAPARAQAPAPADGTTFATLSAGGQFQSHAFSNAKTFDLFGETGTVTSVQTVGRGLVLDASFGYRISRPIAVALGLSTFNGKGNAVTTAAIPNPLFGGAPTITQFAATDYGDLSQTNIAVNFQIVLMAPLTDRFDLAVFAGPSVVWVKQQVASATADLNPEALIESQSKTTAKAANAGVQLTYRMSERYGIGGFVRYLGGEVDLPTVPEMQIGGMQAGGVIRYQF